jgi:hypothetical protein
VGLFTDATKSVNATVNKSDFSDFDFAYFNIYEHLNAFVLECK